LIERGMAMGGPRGATELVLRSVAGDETYERMDAQLRERLLSNGDVFFDIEMAAYLSYEPTPQELETIQIPCAVTAGADNRDESVSNHWRYEAAQWLAAHLHTTVVELPGGHMSYLGQPHAFAEALQQLLHSLGN
jgi:pimeloyl-ACP methyl ester carboxylesterase